MSEIVEFLLARLAEDERVPKLLEARGWLDDDPGGPYEQGADGPYVEVSARRVLTEVEAKRRIVELHKPGDLLDHYEFGCTCGFSDHRWSQCKGCGAILDDEGELDRGIRNCACPTLRLLALPYADHEHYRQEWRP